MLALLEFICCTFLNFAFKITSVITYYKKVCQKCKNSKKKPTLGNKLLTNNSFKFVMSCIKHYKKVFYRKYASKRILCIKNKSYPLNIFGLKSILITSKVFL